jgi:hypothetical protein
METVMVMANCNRNGNGRWQWQWQWPTASAMATATATETAAAITMATVTAKVMITLLSQRLTQGRVTSLCASNVQCCGRGNALPSPPGHKGVCIAQCCAMGVPLQRVFAPFQGGGILRAHQGLVFYFFQLPVQFTKITLCSPTPIQSPKTLVSLLTVYPGSYCTFCQGKLWWGLQCLYHYF